MRIDELFCQSIDKNFHLERQEKEWTIEGNKDVKIRAPINNSIGFCLDLKKNKPFPFFADPPKHVAKMCDGIIVLSHKGKDYIFVIELKSVHPDRYKKQLKNGQYFCDWLLTLLRAYEHYKETVNFIGLLCYEPRETPSKGTTSHQPNRDFTDHEGLPIYEYTNQRRIDLIDIIECKKN